MDLTIKVFIINSNFSLPRFKTILYNFILHSDIHSEKRNKVTGSSQWLARTNQINFLYKEQRAKPQYKDPIRTNDKETTKLRRIIDQKNLSYSTCSCKTREKHCSPWFIALIHLSNVEQNKRNRKSTDVKMGNWE